jgi:hypothetical protein
LNVGLGRRQAPSVAHGDDSEAWPVDRTVRKQRGFSRQWAQIPRAACLAGRAAFEGGEVIQAMLLIGNPDWAARGVALAGLAGRLLFSRDSTRGESHSRKRTTVARQTKVGLRSCQTSAGFEDVPAERSRISGRHTLGPWKYPPMKTGGDHHDESEGRLAGRVWCKALKPAQAPPDRAPPTGDAAHTSRGRQIPGRRRLVD